MSPSRPSADGAASSPSLVLQARPNPRSFFVRDPLPSTEAAAEAASPSPGPPAGTDGRCLVSIFDSLQLDQSLHAGWLARHPTTAAQSFRVR